MTLLSELIDIIEEAVSKKTAAATYHRDYLKTKKKPYRKYHPDDYKKRMKESVLDTIVDEVVMELHVPSHAPLQSGNDEITDDQLTVRTALVDHLQATPADMARVQNALSLDEAAIAARNIAHKVIPDLPESSIVDAVAEAVARAYWNK